MLNLRSRREIERMRRAGAVVGEAISEAKRATVVGIRSGELDQIVRDVFDKYRAEPLFLGYRFAGSANRAPFPAVACVSVNDEVVHGIPSDRRIEEGDIVSIDTGCRLDGWCADSAVSIGVGRVSSDRARLLEVGRNALDLAVQAMAECRWWSEVAGRIEAFVRSEGFSIVEEFVGHGIGRELHEDPEVPNYRSDEFSDKDFELRPGVVIAIEPMVNMGSKAVKCRRDMWTQVTEDGLPSVHFEHTVAILPEGPTILTGRGAGGG